jgi:hypothetical protein
MMESGKNGVGECECYNVALDVRCIRQIRGQPRKILPIDAFVAALGTGWLKNRINRTASPTSPVFRLLVSRYDDTTNAHFACPPFFLY